MSYDPTVEDTEDAVLYRQGHDADTPIPVDEYIAQQLQGEDPDEQEEPEYLLDEALEAVQDKYNEIKDKAERERLLQLEYLRLRNSVEGRFYMGEYHVDKEILQEAEGYRYQRPYNWYPTRYRCN